MSEERGGLGTIRRPAVWTVVVCVCILGLVAGGVTSVYLLNRPTAVRSAEITIPKGMSVPRIARELHRQGLIRSPKLLRLFSVLNGTSRRLTAGVHAFHGGMTTWQVLLELEVPRDVTRDVTLAEGRRLEQIVGVLADSLRLSREKLTSLALDPSFCKEAGVAAKSLEGYLFPETYRFSLASDEKQVLRTLVEHFWRVFTPALEQRARSIGMTIHEAVTLASIIEGEARLDEERPLISAVYHNRLKRNMRLQADPTVQYAIEDGPRRLFNKDYRVDSPYNTYRHRGLPPGPIMSPGEASIRAALWPAEEGFLYFVAQGDGSHLFSRTMEEHEAAKRKTRIARRKSWSARR